MVWFASFKSLANNISAMATILWQYKQPTQRRTLDGRKPGGGYNTKIPKLEPVKETQGEAA